MMSAQPDQTRCQELLSLLESASDDAESERILRLVAAHITTCPQCAVSEERLSGLLRDYAGTEPPPITDDVENRLLSHICDPH